ncbi:MAG: NAD(P)-dependent malic enzyme [Ancrocorticia sp.]|uniref:NAD(P)-dependent malic enzyme n=1 Tax=Ancrocorticia sp. TaxID=2593684 RepID=UPI003F933978
MPMTSPSYTVTMRVQVPSNPRATQHLVEAVADASALVTGIDMLQSEADSLTVLLTCDCVNTPHVNEVRDRIEMMVGTRVIEISDATLEAHKGGKISVSLKNPLRTRQDLARIYTPGVARVCKKIARDKDYARQYTIKKNTVAVVTDGTAVLGLGDIGPEAALPVMEGKAALFKEFGGVDAWPVCLDTKDTEEIISIVKAIAPVYGGINLEDISAPRCFEIEERLRDELDIPVFHDDQHGTAIVTLAALINALRVVDKKIEDVRIVLSGVGAAGSAIIRLLKLHGATDIIGCGRNGALGPFREEANPHRNWLAQNTNPRGVEGSLKDVLAGADVFIGVSSGNILTGDDIATMADDAIVFAMSNPTPEVDPADAGKHAAIVATGRSDYPNQINNVLVFPGLFKGMLKAGASQIDDEMLRAAAIAVANVVGDDQRNPNYIIPGVFDSRVADNVSAAVATYIKENQ